MRCPYLRGTNILQCGAVQCTVVLSGCELESLCKGETFKRCPVYRARRVMKEGKVPLNEYCVIFSSWVRKTRVPERHSQGVG